MVTLHGLLTVLGDPLQQTLTIIHFNIMVQHSFINIIVVLLIGIYTSSTLGADDGKYHNDVTGRTIFNDGDNSRWYSRTV